MRGPFLLVLAAFAFAYTVLAFRLDLLGMDGTLGPGFVPRVIGVAMLAALAPDLWGRVGRPDAANDRDLPAAVRIGALTVGFVALAPLVGTVAAAALYLLVSLGHLNRGRLRVNLALSLAVPALAYLVFVRWLDVALPAGLMSALR